jgi:hypothetical protein
MSSVRGVPVPPGNPQDLGFWIDQLINNGWQPCPVHNGKKQPIGERWSSRQFDRTAFISLLKKHQRLGIALRLDDLVVIDIDEEDEARAAAIAEKAIAILGDSPAIRFGRRPRRALIYHASHKIAPSHYAEPKLEIRAGRGQQLVAFNLHRDTRLPYEWPSETPLSLGVWQLPSVSSEQLREFLRSVGIDDEQRKAPPQGKGQRASDGRDRLLRDAVAAVIGRWKARGWALERDGIVREVWQQFAKQADLTRPKGAGGGLWGVDDVRKKVDYLLRPNRAPRIRAAAGSGKFWTLNRKINFNGLLAMDGRLTAADRSVGWEMIQAVHDDRGLSYLSAKTIAERAGVHETTATMSRQKLIRLHYFVEIDAPIRGIRGTGRRPVVCSPNQKLVEPVSDAAATAAAA